MSHTLDNGEHVACAKVLITWWQCGKMAPRRSTALATLVVSTPLECSSSVPVAGARRMIWAEKVEGIEECCVTLMEASGGPLGEGIGHATTTEVQGISSSLQETLDLPLQDVISNLLDEPMDVLSTVGTDSQLGSVDLGKEPGHLDSETDGLQHLQVEAEVHEPGGNVEMELGSGSRKRTGELSDEVLTPAQRPGKKVSGNVARSGLRSAQGREEGQEGKSARDGSSFLKGRQGKTQRHRGKPPLLKLSSV